MNLINKIRCSAMLSLALLKATLSDSSSYTGKEREKEEFVKMPGAGLVLKALYDKGLDSLDPKTASAINSVYLLSKNHDEGRRVSNVPAWLAFKAQTCNVSVEDGPHRGIYDRDNIWDTIESSRALYVEKIWGNLLEIDQGTYRILNEPLKEIVAHGRNIICQHFFRGEEND